MPGFGERMFLTRRVRRQFKVQLIGSWTVEKYRRGESVPYEVTERKKNSIDSGGFDLFLGLLTGDEVAFFDDTNATARLMSSDATPSEVKLFVGPDSIASGTNTKSAPAYTMRFSWYDDSINIYTFRYLDFWNGDPTNPADRGDGEVPTRFGRLDYGSDQTKPADENWHYHYDLEIYSTDTDFDSNGFARMHLAMEGVNDPINLLTTTRVRLRPTDASDVESSGSDLNADSVTLSTSGDKITFVFTAVDGVFESTWAKTKIKHYDGTSLVNIRFGGCKTDGTSCGTKGAGEEWQYTYEILAVQGS